MSRLRRLVVSDRYFFVTCNRLRTRAALNDDDFEILARVIDARRREHGFLLTAWVFLPVPSSQSGAAGFGREAGGLAVVERARVRAAGKRPVPWRVRLAD